MSIPVLKKSYILPDIDIKEVLRYASSSASDRESTELLSECIEEASGIFRADVCYTETELNEKCGILDFVHFKTPSETLKKNLSGCTGVIIFCATVGFEIDRLIQKYSVLSPARALMFQALGAERIEALADAFALDIRNEKQKNGLLTKPRVSPGYGDISLELQRDIFRILGCEKRIGLTLNGTLTMSPTKSVSAFIGIYRKTE